MSLKAEFKRGWKKLRLSLRKREKLGITLPNMFRVLRDLKAGGQLDGLTKSEKAILLRDRMRYERASAMDAQMAIDPEFWTRLLAFIKFILPFLLMFI